MTSYCDKHPHMSNSQLEKLRSRIGERWLEHYGMLSAAAEGSVQCVQHYHALCSTLSPNPVSVWSGSFSDRRFNAWRSTFENQNATSLKGQESVRSFLRCLGHAEEHIIQTQQKWAKNQLLERRDELTVEAGGRQSSKQSVDNIDESEGKRSLGRWQNRKRHEQQVSEPVAEWGLGLERLPKLRQNKPVEGRPSWKGWRSRMHLGACLREAGIAKRSPNRSCKADWIGQHA